MGRNQIVKMKDLTPEPVQDSFYDLGKLQKSLRNIPN